MFHITLALFPNDNNCPAPIFTCFSFCCLNASFCTVVTPFCGGGGASCCLFSVQPCVCSHTHTRICLLYIHGDSSAMCVRIGTGGAFTPHSSLLMRGDKWELTGSGQQWARFKNIANCQEILCACTLNTHALTHRHLIIYCMFFIHLVVRALFL